MEVQPLQCRRNCECACENHSREILVEWILLSARKQRTKRKSGSVSAARRQHPIDLRSALPKSGLETFTCDSNHFKPSPVMARPTSRNDCWL